MRRWLLMFVPWLLLSVSSVACCKCASLPKASVDEEDLAVCLGSIALRSTPSLVDSTFPVGPIVVRADQHKATIMWEPSTFCDDGELAFGLAANKLDQRVAANRDERILKARLNKLSTDTRYHYQARACGKQSAVLEFTTAPAPSAPIRFAVWGDSQSHPERSAPIVEQMKRERPHMTLHVGDMVGDGGIYEQWRDEHFSPLKPIGHYLPTHSAMGNHERNAKAYYRYTDNPISGAFTDSAEWGANYSIRYGNTFFLVLDTNSPHLLAAEQEPDSRLVEWIEAQLRSEQARSATWRIAAAHHPALTECWSPGKCDSFAGLEVIEKWLFPRLAKHGFQAYFCGHTHAYERGRIEGLLHMISGGGGGDLDEWCRNVEQTEVYVISHHHILVDAGCDRMTLRAYRAGESKPFDEVILKRETRQPPP